jgi:predicted ArsR family transcriptional regulator
MRVSAASERESRQGRQQVLGVIREASAPLSVAEVAERVRLHINTVRGHLELLTHLGVVTRQTEHRGGTGSSSYSLPARPREARP